MFYSDTSIETNELFGFEDFPHRSEQPFSNAANKIQRILPSLDATTLIRILDVNFNLPRGSRRKNQFPGELKRAASDELKKKLSTINYGALVRILDVNFNDPHGPQRENPFPEELKQAALSEMERRLTDLDGNPLLQRGILGIDFPQRENPFPNWLKRAVADQIVENYPGTHLALEAAKYTTTYTENAIESYLQSVPEALREQAKKNITALGPVIDEVAEYSQRAIKELNMSPEEVYGQKLDKKRFDDMCRGMHPLAIV